MFKTTNDNKHVDIKRYLKSLHVISPFFSIQFLNRHLVVTIIINQSYLIFYFFYGMINVRRTVPAKVNNTKSFAVIFFFISFFTFSD